MSRARKQKEKKNLRLVSVTEWANGGTWSNSSQISSPLYSELTTSPLVVIDWAHHTLALQRPWAILIRLHYYADRQKILGLGKTKGRLSYRRDQVYIFPDISLDVSRQCVTFNPVKWKLQEANVTYSLFYPASLAINVVLDTPLIPQKLQRTSTTRRLPKWTDSNARN